MPFQGQPIYLTDAQRHDLEAIPCSNGLPAGFVRSAKFVLLLADVVFARVLETEAGRFAVGRRQVALRVLGGRRGESDQPPPQPDAVGVDGLRAARYAAPIAGRDDSLVSCTTIEFT